MFTDFAAAAGPEEDLAGSERGEYLRRALRELSPEHREVIELTFFQGYSYGGIAEIVKCPVATVKTRVFYARKKLQELLREMGVFGRIA